MRTQRTACIDTNAQQRLTHPDANAFLMDTTFPRCLQAMAWAVELHGSTLRKS